MARPSSRAGPPGNGVPGGGSLWTVQKTPICFTASTKHWKSTGFTT